MPKFKITLLIFTAFIFTFSWSALMAQKQLDYELHFKNMSFTPDSQIGNLTLQSIPADQLFEGKYFTIIQFYSIPSELDRSNLSDAGVLLLDYIPHYSYFTCFEPGFNPNVLTNANVRAIVSITEAVKLSPQLFVDEIPDHAFKEDGRVELLVGHYPNLNREKVAQALVSAGFEVLLNDSFGEFIPVLSSVENIKYLARQPYVVYVEPIYPTPEPDNYSGRTLHRSNGLASDFSTGRHYDGTGVNVMLQDDGIIGPHIDYQGRILDQYLGNNNGNHGDHCAGIIMGGGNLDPRARGNAFGANIYVYSANNYSGFLNIPSHYSSNQIRVTSTSYSNGCNAGYTSLTRTMDQHMRMYRKLLHVFSAGNAGGEDCGYGAGVGWGNITGGHKAAKNVFTVANLNETDGLNSSSSRGPAHDGRIKPEISAKGTDVYSTIDPNSYDFKTGTSMSCPGVAGVVTQLFHAFRELNDGNDPTGGLIKAIVMNTAEDLGNPGPDFKFGFGRINGRRAVEVLEQGRYDSAVINTNQIIEHQFEVPQNTAEARIMVYWVDFEATVNTNWALVNNLDIKVTDPSGNEWLPWVLSHYPKHDSLNKPAVRGIDDRNNQEQVTLSFPEPGQYTLTVTGTTIPQGPQTYYIIYDFVPDEVVLTYPFGGELWRPGADELLRWDASGNEGLFTLEYSLDNGNSWYLIKNDVAGTARHYNWIVPSTLTGQALVKISREGSTSQCNVPITIAPIPTELKVDWACANDIHLSWNEVYGASGYVIYKLGEKYMEPVGTTNINSFILEDSPSNLTYWFSVSAITPDGAVGQRANAVQKLPGTLNCHTTDAKMLDAPSVDWGLFQTCMEISNLDVTIRMKNFGLEPIINPTFHFQLNDGEIVNEVYQGTIMPDSLLTFTFSQGISINNIGTYSLKSWVEYAPDTNPQNDEIITNFEVIEGTTILPGTIQTMESFQQCLPVPICELYSCNLDDGWINLTNQVQDDIDWRTWKGSTYSFNTGPSFDHTIGTISGQYLYLEASTICFNKEAILSLPCIDLTNRLMPVFSVWYHAFGADMGRLHVDLFDGSQIIRDIVPPVIGDQGDEWRQLTADLSPWTGKTIGIRIRGITGSGDKSDLAIDDIAVLDVTSVNSLKTANDELKVYPNPGKGVFNITLDTQATGNFQLSVTDITGKVRHKENIAISNGQFYKALDLGKLPNGVYFLELKSDKAVYQTKLLKN
ncbi:MAG TPA: S8 family serine peptidase [Bacteroidales bacterium]|mgnify:CR=1 FL=1|nr:MAG: Thermophilic serine proteinase precursor [Bacteroidetes bacterium ADurb.Bin041]HNV50588.1 S8 family serine peptidase [Bacteroidales bacterium]HNY59604.1 S8 family serine peptidase [Bacteroidales bacterium]HOG66713.1 S8 family serine peptidase [Bacteroidales bacterium]HPA12577.1 S8 family serine peptidase [Bacteroidales bacterium]